MTLLQGCKQRWNSDSGGEKKEKCMSASLAIIISYCVIWQWFIFLYIHLENVHRLYTLVQLLQMRFNLPGNSEGLWVKFQVSDSFLKIIKDRTEKYLFYDNFKILIIIIVNAYVILSSMFLFSRLTVIIYTYITINRYNYIFEKSNFFRFIEK